MDDFSAKVMEAMVRKRAMGDLLLQAAAVSEELGADRNEVLRAMLAALRRTCDRTIDFTDVWGRSAQRNCAKPPAYLFMSRLPERPHQFYCAFHANRVYLNKPALPGWVLGVVDLREEA